ncbi:MAG: hypothetical protein ACO1SX_24270 [Actinomycetota bacterium]
MAADPGLTVARRRARARLCLFGAWALAIAAAGVLVDRGGLRRRIGHVRRVAPNSTLLYPRSLVLERHGDGEVHYGLLFRTPSRGRYSRLAWHSVLDTHLCDRGPIERWQGRMRSFDEQTLEVIVFLPRSWLILQGFLPLRAGLSRRRPHALRDEKTLLGSFWMEAYGAPRPVHSSEDGR